MTPLHLLLSDPLGKELVVLARRFSDYGRTLTLGGGYGITLRRRLWNPEQRTVLENPPPARSTGDLDLFLDLELIGDPDAARYLRRVLDERGYEPVEGAENYQFSRPLEEYEGQVIKVDLLTPDPESVNADRSVLDKLRLKDRRVRPRGASGFIHATRLTEAITLSHKRQEILIQKQKDEAPVSVYLPQVFTFIVLKVQALAERLGGSEEDEEKAQNHVYDLYIILATTTRDEWENARHLFGSFQGEQPIQEVRGHIEQLFQTTRSPGMVRLRRQLRVNEDRPDEETLDSFREQLGRLFEISLS